MSALLTYALNKEKVLVNIDDVAKGGACHCVCPQCGNPLIAKNGGLKREHHFAHFHGEICEDAYETTLHLLAKEVLLECGKIMLPPKTGDFPTGQVALHNMKQETWDAEYNIKPDFEGIMPNGERLLIELYVSHKVSDQKRNVVIKNNLKCLEIDLNYVELNKEALKKFLLEETDDRYWIVPSEDKPKSYGDGEGGYYYRNPLHDEALKTIKDRFEDGTLAITWKDKVYKLKDLKYDVCESKSSSFRGMKSDLLLYRSKEEKDKGHISINVRGRRRNFDFRYPKNLRIIDIVIKESYELEWFKGLDSLMENNNIIFNGFKDKVNRE